MKTQIQEAIQSRLEEGQLSCCSAHAIARELDVAPLTVGQAANEADIRIFQCQLGLFGYGPKAEGKHKIVVPLEHVPERLTSQLQARADEQGISCLDIWQVADELGYKRMEASGAVEAMGLRVSTCQLGCFPRPGNE